MTTQVQTLPRLHPRAVYWLDAAVSFLMGVAVAALAGPLTTLVGWPLPTTFLLAAGLILIPWAAYGLWTARSARVSSATLGVHLVVDFAWVVGSIALALANSATITPIGFALVVGQAVAVAGVGLVKLMGARALLA